MSETNGRDDALPSDMFTMVEKSGSTFLMRGKICFGEINADGETWSAWGYGLDRIGVFPSWDDAARAVVADAWKTLDEASLKPIGHAEGAPG